MKRRWQLAIVLTLSILALVACNNDKTEEQGQDINNEMQQVEPDLTEVPDIVAEVNGQEISRDKFELTYLSQFQQAAFEAQMSGQTFDQEQFKQELADSMIDLELLIQEADRHQFTATDQDIDELVAENSLESEEILYEIYEEQGMSRDQLREELTQQIKLDQLISDQSEGLSISEEQVIELYEELIVIYEEMEQDGELPSIDEIRGDLENQIRYQEENLLIIELIEQLRNESEIINHMS